MALAIDPLWLELPEDQPLFRVWRIEKFRPVAWADIGGFYTGDSYIVLKAMKVGASQRIRRDIHFWIGSASTADEYGTAAIESIELDDRFGGEPTQHDESSAFHELFKEYGGVRNMEGGIASGFRAVTASAGVRLDRVKRQRNPVLLEVPAAAAPLNHGGASS
jgi:gelsolin